MSGFSHNNNSNNNNKTDDIYDDDDDEMMEEGDEPEEGQADKEELEDDEIEEFEESNENFNNNNDVDDDGDDDGHMQSREDDVDDDDEDDIKKTDTHVSYGNGKDDDEDDHDTADLLKRVSDTKERTAAPIFLHTSSLTQDSKMTSSIRSINDNNADLTQDTIEQAYNDDEDEDDEADDGGVTEGDSERKRKPNQEKDIHLGLEAEEGQDTSTAHGTIEMMDAEENNDDDDTSLEEGEGKEEHTKEGTDEVEGDTADVKMDTTTGGKSTSTKPEAATSYSTRGRTQEENNFDRLAAVGDLLSLGATHRDAANVSLLQSPETRMRESFLSDSLTEEERRTRTRYIPAVDGMHALRKQEIKNDLALARSTLTAAGVTEKIARSAATSTTTTKRKHPDDETSGMDGMDTTTGSSTMKSDDAAAIQSAEEDKAIIGMGLAPKTIEIGSNTLSIPSSAFVAPSIDTSITKKATPREVDVSVAFNPPRPPESIGAKKKHRMLRWERRPSDIETDLNSYRKTVQKTREELKSAEGELERIRVVDNQLRRHFLQHIQCMNCEIQCIGEEITIIQQECVDMVDLPNSRTRTRGAFKGQNTMKDVLHTLRAKGKEIEAKGLVLNGGSSQAHVIASDVVPGVGGVSASSFIDWDRSSKIEPCKLAEAWVIPGEKVMTPYGAGIVHSVYGPSHIDTTEPPNHDLFPKPTALAPSVEVNDAMDIEDSENLSVSVNSTSSKKKGAKIGKKTESVESNAVSLVNVIAPRIAVRLPFGVAYFNVESVKSVNDPATYTDDQLAKRWLGLAETASVFGSTLDVSAMAKIISLGSKVDPASRMIVDEANQDTKNKGDNTTEKLVPFGSGMFPTAVGRGTNLHKLPLVELDETVTKAFYKGNGVLGNKNNLGVTTEIRTLEDTKQEHLNLQAKVLQLRNQLYRQRRIRMLNERTYMSSHERASKIESLVAEMRMDLKSLKSRLDLEIRDLGISDDQAEAILKAFYTSQDTLLNGETSSSPSRLLPLSQVNETDDGAVSNMDTATSILAPGQ